MSEKYKVGDQVTAKIDGVLVTSADGSILLRYRKGFMFSSVPIEYVTDITVKVPQTCTQCHQPLPEDAK